MAQGIRQEDCQALIPGRAGAGAFGQSSRPNVNPGQNTASATSAFPAPGIVPPLSPITTRAVARASVRVRPAGGSRPCQPADQAESDIPRLRVVAVGDRAAQVGEGGIGVHDFSPVHHGRGGAGAFLPACVGLQNRWRPSSSFGRSLPRKAGRVGSGQHRRSARQRSRVAQAARRQPCGPAIFRAGSGPEPRKARRGVDAARPGRRPDAEGAARRPRTAARSALRRRRAARLRPSGGTARRAGGASRNRPEGPAPPVPDGAVRPPARRVSGCPVAALGGSGGELVPQGKGRLRAPRRTASRGCPMALALSARFSLIPLPGNRITPIGRVSSILSLRLNGAALLWRASPA